VGGRRAGHLQFNHASVTTVGIRVGLMFTLAGIQSLALASVPGMTARWAWALFGVLFREPGDLPRLRTAAGPARGARLEGCVVDELRCGNSLRIHTRKFAAMIDTLTIGNCRAGIPSDGGIIGQACVPTGEPSSRTSRD
jgi:hypothetical protein